MDLMTGQSEGFLGRQLLSLRNRIQSGPDPSVLRKLRRREIRILTELGNNSAAIDNCRKLIEDNPSWAPGYSIMADLLCRTGEWAEAETQFEKSASMHESAGNTEGAGRLRTGPVFRLAESRGDYERCISLSSGSGDLNCILNVRARRLSEGTTEIEQLSEPENWLAAKLYHLEAAWSGSAPQGLLEQTLDWENTEPEWRWRFIVEGRQIWKIKGMDLSGWSRPVKNTVCPVLDPRFHAEWRTVSNDR
jgi:tetratricopeptide (TPR) repeat protein